MLEHTKQNPRDFHRLLVLSSFSEEINREGPQRGLRPQPNLCICAKNLVAARKFVEISTKKRSFAKSDW